MCWRAGFDAVCGLGTPTSLIRACWLCLSVSILQEFLLKEPDDVTPERSKANYEKYQVEFKERAAKGFFERHHQDEW